MLWRTQETNAEPVPAAPSRRMHPAFRLQLGSSLGTGTGVTVLGALPCQRVVPRYATDADVGELDVGPGSTRDPRVWNGEGTAIGNPSGKKLPLCSNQKGSTGASLQESSECPKP